MIINTQGLDYSKADYFIRTHNITTDTLKRWRDAGKVKYFTITDRIFLYCIDDVKKCIENKRKYTKKQKGTI